MSNNLDETVRLQSEKRQEWIREIREKRLQGIAEGASNAPCLASSSAAPFLGRNECLGTHCSLIEKKEREDSSWKIFQKDCGKRKNGEEKRSGRLVGAAETSKEHTEWRRLQQGNLNILGLLKRKEWPQCHRESSWQVR